MKETSLPDSLFYGKINILFILLGILSLALFISSSIGPISISLAELLTGTLTNQDIAILWSIRLPRVFLAVIVGASLAVSGAAMQGLFRNPLADPGLIGIASGAALAVSLFIVVGGLFNGTLGLYALSIAAFTGGLITCLLIFRFAQLNSEFSVTYMLLAGIAINAIAGAGIGILTFISDDQQIRVITIWMMGSIGGAVWPAVIVATTIIITALFLLITNARALNILLLGEDEAMYLGVDSKRVKRTIIICTALSVGAAVAVSGIIGFIGLVVPHLIRLTIGPDHRLLLPASAVMGGLLLVVADTFARTVMSPAELPVGLITSLIGGPFFLWLLMKQYSGRF
jgi:iron complex transport system permease protein